MSEPATNQTAPAGTQQGPAENFVGTAWVKILVKADGPTDCSVGDVTFEPGARNNWHSHPAGQVLVVTTGRGYYQEKGQPARLLHPGEAVSIAPGVQHWHGASPKQALTYIALNVNTEKGVVTWLQPVTDAEYRSYR